MGELADLIAEWYKEIEKEPNFLKWMDLKEKREENENDTSKTR